MPEGLEDDLVWGGVRCCTNRLRRCRERPGAVSGPRDGAGTPAKGESEALEIKRQSGTPCSPLPILVAADVQTAERRDREPSFVGRAEARGTKKERTAGVV